MFDALKKIASNILQRREVKTHQARMYNGAKVNRLTQDWVYSQLSANEEIRRGVKLLRDRSRDLERNNDHIRRYLQMVESNVIGRGVKLKVKAKDSNGTIDKMASDYLEASFLKWANFADASGIMRWLDLQRLIVRTVARDGGCLIRLLRGGQYKDGIGLDVLEIDYLDENFFLRLDNGNRVIMSVEIDDHCKPVAYWLWQGNPADAASGVGFFTGQRIRVPASEIIHVYRAERPQQVRGVPWCSSAIQTLHMLEGYQEAELVAARTASCKMGFYKIPPGEDFTPDAEGSQGPLSDASPGTFERLPTGWDFVQYDPQHPGANFDKFVKSILRSAAGGLNVAYNNFANDLDGVSYSSIRSGTLEERENWMVVQDWFINSFCSPLYSAWLESALLTQSVKLPFAKLEKFRADTWTGRRWPWVDPLNDVQTREKELQLGITSKSQMVSEQGKDFAEVQAQIAADRAIETANQPADAQGLVVTSTGDTAMSVEDTAMNGAQVTAAIELVKEIVFGNIPRETGVMMLAQFFKIDQSDADKMIGAAGSSLKKQAPIDASANGKGP